MAVWWIIFGVFLAIRPELAAVVPFALLAVVVWAAWGLRRFWSEEFMQECNRVEHLEFGESLDEFASFGGFGFHEVEKVAVRGEEIRGFRS